MINCFRWFLKIPIVKSDKYQIIIKTYNQRTSSGNITGWKLFDKENLLIRIKFTVDTEEQEQDILFDIRYCSQEIGKVIGELLSSDIEMIK